MTNVFNLDLANLNFAVGVFPHPSSIFAHPSIFISDPVCLIPHPSFIPITYPHSSSLIPLDNPFPLTHISV